MPIFIGDVHGKYPQYKRIIREHQNTIQVGDMGVGFFKWPHGEPYANPPFDEMLHSGARFIRGNHDNPAVCRKHQMWIPDGTVEDDMMFIGGAFSIDKAYRIEDFNWWPDEELSYKEFENLVDVYNVAKPACMVTHDCPVVAVNAIHSHHRFDNSRTQQCLQILWEMHKPKVWVFGHHHQSFDKVIDGTRFVCLDELEVKEINWNIIKP
jgi:Calcineurin-like phosphoesterase